KLVTGVQTCALPILETRYALSNEPGGIIAEIRADVLEERFPETAVDLELRGGRPRQLPWRYLREQVQRRARLGQPVREWELALRSEERRVGKEGSAR